MLVIYTNNSFAAPKNELFGLPKQCVVNDKSEHCKTELTLSWTLQTAQDICILKNAEIIYCEKQSSQSSYIVNINNNNTVTFKLVAMDTLVELSKFKFNVLYLGKTSIKRRKLPWRLL